MPDLAGWLRTRLPVVPATPFTRGGTDTVRLEPFGAFELELAALWPTLVSGT